MNVNEKHSLLQYIVLSNNKSNCFFFVFFVACVQTTQAHNDGKLELVNIY